MVTWIHRRLQRDDGLSLVEMMVAILILGIVMTGLASSSITSLTAITSHTQLVRANALGNEIVETLQALPWERLGFYSSDFGGTPPSGTVLLPGSRPAAANPCWTAPPEPACNVNRDGTDYHVALGIVWVDDAVDGLGMSDADGDPDDYKHVDVDLSWQNRGDTEQLHLEGVVAPGVGAKSFLELLTLAPKGVLLDSNFENDDPVDITAFTERPATAGTKVEFTDRNGTAHTLPLLDQGGSTEWYRQLAAGSYEFANGETVFTVTAVAADNGEVGVANDRIVFYQGLAIQTPDLSDDPIDVLAATDTLCDPLTLSVEVHGLTRIDSVTATWTDGPAEATLAFVSGDVNGSAFEHVYPITDTFTSSSTVLTIEVERGFDGAIETYTETISVDARSTC